MSIKSSAKVKGIITNIETHEWKAFQFNPTVFSYNRSATFNETSSPTSPYPLISYSKGDSSEITLPLVMHDPAGKGIIAPYIKFLESFLPQKDTSAFIERNPKPKILLFSYGAFVVRCVMKSLSVDYNRFSEGSVPLQADINVVLLEIGDQLIDPGKYRPVLIKVPTPSNIKQTGTTYIPYVTVDVGVHCEYSTHCENVGWSTSWAKDGATSGTTGLSQRLEAVMVRIKKPSNVDLTVKYQAHVQNEGWQYITLEGSVCGTVGEATRLEAMKFWLEGADAGKYDIFYKFHVQDLGWMGWAKNGSPAGSAGFSLRAEAIQMMIMPKK